MSIQPPPARAALSRPDFEPLKAELGLARLDMLPSSGSTNTDLADLAARGEAGDRSVYFTEHQQQGKGRLGRSWQTPPGAALTLSVYLQPGGQVPAQSLSWYTMLAAVAWRRAIHHAAGIHAEIKWPNDLLAQGRKICGILAQAVPVDGQIGVVIGTGLNVDQDREELPVDTATSLRLAAGRPVDRAELLGAYLRELVALDDNFRQVNGDARAALPDFTGQSLTDLVCARLATLGAQVRVEFPDGGELLGVARSLEPDGALLVRDAHGAEHRVLAGDVHHVRRADGKYA